MCCVVFCCLCADGIIPYAYAAIVVYVMSYDLTEVHLVNFNSESGNLEVLINM
jgi:hypothetical protein